MREYYISKGDGSDDHMIEGIPGDSAYHDEIEGPSFRDRHRPTVAPPAHPAETEEER